MSNIPKVSGKIPLEYQLLSHMAISPDSPIPNDSPWYKLMENKAIAWNEFAEVIKAEISGNYNAHIVSFQLTKIINNTEIIIEGRRQLTTVVSGLVPRDGRFSETLKVRFLMPDISPDTFLKVTKKGFLNAMGLKFQNLKLSRKTEEYLISFNSKSIHELLLNSGILHSKKIGKLEITKKGFELLMYELPEESNVITNIYNFARTIIQTIDKDNSN